MSSNFNNRITESTINYYERLASQFATYEEVVQRQRILPAKPFTKLEIPFPQKGKTYTYGRINE